MCKRKYYLFGNSDAGGQELVTGLRGHACSVLHRHIDAERCKGP